MNGKAVPSALFQDLSSNAIPPQTAQKLGKISSCDFIQTPLKDAVQVLNDQSETQIIIDPRFCDINLPIVQSLGGIDLASLLVLLLHEHGLDCDYRHECLWITSAAEARRIPSFRLSERLNQGADADEATRNTLTQITETDFIDTPLKDAVQILRDRSGIPVLVDATSVDGELPIRLKMRDVTLQSAISAMCDRHDLDCDYRYGALWIIARNEDAAWSDPTGVSALIPPEGSRLEAAWDKDVYNEQASEEPLTSFVARLAHEKSVDIDIYRIGGVERLQIRTSWKNLPLRDVLGIFLAQNDLRCRLEGEKLVLTPSEYGGAPTLETH